MSTLLLIVAAAWGGEPAHLPAGELSPAVEGALHARLEASVPSDGDTLPASPPEIRLTFSGPVEETGASVVLLGSEGRSWTLDAALDTEDRRALVAIPPALSPGGYRIEWRVISADGHPVAGEVVFFVDGDALGDLPGPPPSSGAAGGHGAGGEGAGSGVHPDGREAEHERSASTLTAGIGADLALVGLLGLLLFTAWSGRDPSPAGARTADVLAVAAAVFTTLHAWLWIGEALGPGVGGPARLDALLTLESGRPLAVRVGAAWLALWGLSLARRRGIGLGFAVVALVAGAASGHPAAIRPALSIPTNGLHLLAASAWVGGLLHLVTESGAPDFPREARRVSTAALAAVALVAVTGVVQAWTFVDGLSGLAGSTYGRLVLAKAGGLVILVAFGAYHRFRLLPRVGASRESARDPAAPALVRSVRMELAVAGAVVALAAVLGHVPPPP